ncbi:steroid receptor RNA activator 1-like [Acanthaster planci]|uniref:Steroid receptor RNA activator 1-like n=1 Tax=Acanthaster planci TaxID=133434 RepID=A0A8B7XF85_ACAPL|nr:steroid receptor RNA activator 1-like [Acanthaster planci]
MAARLTRPGNPERGWNDPPMFMYNKDGQKVQSSPRKNPLTQRVGMSQSYTSSIQSTGHNKPGPPPAVLPGAPPVASVPPLQLFSSPPTEENKMSPARSSEVKGEEEEQSELPGDICITTMAKLRNVLQLCQEKLKVRVAEDIKKRMDALNTAWTGGKLSVVVQQRMDKLSTALADRDYNRAHDVHLSLMVDYVAEVSQWMVGIKRLIMEARTILPPPLPSSETGGGHILDQPTDNRTETDKDNTDQVEEAVNGSPPIVSAAASGEDNQQTPRDGEGSQDETGQSTKEQELKETTAVQDEIPPAGDSESQLAGSESSPRLNRNEEGEASDFIRQSSSDETKELLDRLPSEKTAESRGKEAVISDSH